MANIERIVPANHRADWSSPRSISAAVSGLQANGFQTAAAGQDATRLVRYCHRFGLRVTICHGFARLEVATVPEAPDQPVRWRQSTADVGDTPWRVAREALELLAVLDIDTPVQWG